MTIRTAWRRVLAAALLAAAPLAQAVDGYTTLTLPTLNVDIRTWSDGASYAPLFAAGANTWNGVPFALTQRAVGQAGNTAFELMEPGMSTDIAAGVAGATTVYTLINSAFGAFGQTNGFVEFFGSGGAYHKATLVQGTNIRDHYNDGFNNVIDGVNAVAAFSAPTGARLDMQIFDLPASFADQTLASIRFGNLGLAQYPSSWGQPFIAAATVGYATTPPIPEPSTYALMALGLFAVACAKRRRPAAD